MNRKISPRHEERQRLVQAYREAGEAWPASSFTIALWAIRKGLWKERPNALARICAKELASAMRLEHHTDRQGRVIRTKRPFRVRIHDDFQTLWGDWREMPEWQAHAAVSLARAQIAGVCKQLRRDVDSYNDNCNPRKHIQLYLDFTGDAEDAEQPTEYAYGRAS